MLPGMAFIGMVAGQLHMGEPVERAMELPPIIQILQERIRLQGRILLRGRQGLEVGLAHQRCFVAGGGEILPHRMPVLRQLGTQRPCAMLAGIQPGNNGGAGRCAGGIGAIGPGKGDALLCQPVQIGRADLRIAPA
ncbi:hypothetical protein D3C76_1281680 [compost metagenome]